MQPKFEKIGRNVILQEVYSNIIPSMRVINKQQDRLRNSEKRRPREILQFTQAGGRIFSRINSISTSFLINLPFGTSRWWNSIPIHKRARMRFCLFNPYDPPKWKRWSSNSSERLIAKDSFATVPSSGQDSICSFGNRLARTAITSSKKTA